MILLLCAIAHSSFKLTTETSYSKLINNDAGLEFKIDAKLYNKSLEAVISFSEGFKAFRHSPFTLNHAGTRFDVGFFWNILDFKLGYIHSTRQWFEGANPRTVFLYDTVDKFVIRKEFNCD